MKKRILSVFICLTLLITLTVPASADAQIGRIVAAGDGYTVTKLSNPAAGEGEVDGLIPGGDRENSYTWRLAMRGDEIYIATARNIASALVNKYGSAFAEAGISLDSFWAMIDLVTNGDILRNDENEGANIISYNRVTGEFQVLYTADPGDYFRMAVTFGDDVYFGSYSANPENPQYILKLDPDGNFTKVFQTMGSISLRANCVYDDHLFFAGADDREEVDIIDLFLHGNPTKMAILRKSNEDDSVWERVADYKDFGDAPYDPIMESWAVSPIWEMAVHNDEIYATAPSSAGFVVFKGHPAQDDEEANAYGWVWQEVAGPNNGVNNPGLSDVEGGEPDTMRSLVGSVYEWNGKLYAYNFDHCFGGCANAFVGALQQLAGKKVKASEYLFYLYDSLQNPQKIWALDDETGKFEEVEAFTALTEGTLNEYIWRMGEYDGSLYIATMDAGVFYNYLTQLTNGSFFSADTEQILQRLQYLRNLLQLLIASGDASILDLDQIRDALLDGVDLLRTLLTMDIDEENLAQFLENYTLFQAALSSAAMSALASLSDMSLDELAIELLTGDVAGQLIDGTLNLADILFQGVDIAGLIPEELTNEFTEQLVSVLQMLQSFSEGYVAADEETQAYYREFVKIIIRNYLESVLNEWKDKINEAFDMIDIEGVRMYLWISDQVKNNEWGFDLFRTSDGENFEVITRDGFGDKYNYGCSAFLETEEGLYLGTCNPFYGGQLYLLQTVEPMDDGLPCDGGDSCPGGRFTDMPPKDHWAHDAIDWAVVHGITAGTSETTFGPDEGCTRAQVVTFLWRAAGAPEPATTDNPFKDVEDGAYYEKPVLWAAENGITAGTAPDEFSPDATCTRAQIVTFLWRYEGNPEPSSTDNPFEDVEAGAYYEKAVLWAAENGITAGTSATTFGPDDTCTRAQVVTFLHRDSTK